MTILVGPDFIGLMAEDLDTAKAFYGDLLGLPTLQSTPEAVVFDSKPIPFAVRKPIGPLASERGSGVALWFACADADALHTELVERGTPIVHAPKDGPFGRYFAFRDPFGYAITAHTT
jgi:predicted enzyme related to lactoylglutathione lyase